MFIVIASLAAIAAVYFWNEIAGFLVNSFLPYIREHVASAQHVVASVIKFVNEGVVTVRNAVKDGYNWIKKNLVHCTTTYQLDQHGNAYSTTVTVINDNGVLSGVESKKAIDKWDMPAEALAELSRNAQAAAINNKDEILRRAELEAQKQSLSLSAVN